MLENEERGIPTSEEDKAKLRELLAKINPEDIKRAANFIVDCFMNFGVFFGLVCLFTW